MRIENRMQLQLWREECKEKRQKENCCILVCGGTGCLAGGSDKIYARLKELTSNMDHVTVKIGEEIAHVGLKMSGCHGFCEMGPLVRIEPYNYLYLKVKLEDCEEIFEKTILHGEPVTRLMYEDNGHVYQTQEEIPFYAKQTRLVLRNCGHIDAEHIEDAMAVGAYESFEKAVFEMTPEAVIKTVTDAGLRGRGGAGFPAGRKWSQVASQPEKIRYVVCNGDEGDPGAFMDRSVICTGAAPSLQDFFLRPIKEPLPVGAVPSQFIPLQAPGPGWPPEGPGPAGPPPAGCSPGRRISAAPRPAPPWTGAWRHRHGWPSPDGRQSRRRRRSPGH